MTRPAAAPETDIVIHGGMRPGPTLLVLMAPELFAVLAARFAEVPSMPWIRGRIVLADLDRIASAPASTLDRLGPIDATVKLPFAATGTADRDGCRHVLSHAASLGIIAGRGIPYCTAPHDSRHAHPKGPPHGSA